MLRDRHRQGRGGGGGGRGKPGGGGRGKNGWKWNKETRGIRISKTAWKWYYWIGKDVNRYSFLYYIIFILSWIFEKSSKFWAAKYKRCLQSPHSLADGLYTESFLPIGWRILFDEKIPPKCCTNLIWIAGCWISILLTRRDLRTIVDSPAFLEAGLAEKITVCAHTTRLSKK